MKETKKQIKAQVINELKKKFDADTKHLVEVNERLTNEKVQLLEKFCDCTKENRKLKEENEQLREENSRYKDWIERMQEFCNLPENERESAFKTYLDSIKADSNMKDVISRMGKFYSNVFSTMM
jgi:cell shape-determining protein MreC